MGTISDTPHPDWNDILAAPCFLLNIDRCADRLAIARERIRAAGFRGEIHRIRGLDRETDALQILQVWERFGKPMFQDRDGFPTNFGKQACALGHYTILQRILDENIPFAVVFEDDVLFHKHWDQLAPWFYENTPKDFDLVLMGASFDVHSPLPVLQTPAFCLHAVIVTRAGAQKALDICLRDPRGTWTIDWMLREVMEGKVAPPAGTEPLQWYVWNGVPWYDERAFTSHRWQENIKNKGLVFQDCSMGTFIDTERV